MTPTIRSNFERWCQQHQIPLYSFEIFEDEPNKAPDRLRLLDMHGLLLSHALGHDWVKGSGKNHGKSVVLSLREPEAPGMQICVHRISEASLPPKPLRPIYLEVDFDEHPPVNALGTILHVGELYETRGDRTTDQGEIAAGLERRFTPRAIPEQVTS